jgi:hypothetical protein
MESTQVLIIILILIMIYLLLQTTRKPLQNRVVYVSNPFNRFIGGQGPLWRGPRPGRFRRRGRRRFLF